MSPTAPESTVSTVSTTTSSPTASPTAPTLRRLYLARFAFAAVWAGIFAATGSTLGALAAVLLVLYPAVDVAAAVLDLRSGTRPAAGLYVNVVVSTVAAVALAVAASGDMADVLRVFGAWAVVAGLVQLIVGVSRRRLGGQWAMIASGGISVLAGGGFIASAGDATTMTNLAGYAALGGIFFLVSAIRLGRGARQGSTITS